MTDKERILMCIVTRVIPGLMYSSVAERAKYAESAFLDPSKLGAGDLVFGNTTITPNDFLVGFVDHVENGYVVIREIGSTRLCNYYNEGFIRINKECLGYEVLEGGEYRLYQKVLKAFSRYTRHYLRFKSIRFAGNICTVEAREAFSNDAAFEISFQFNSKTSIKEIGTRLKEADESKTATTWLRTPEAPVKTVPPDGFIV